MQTLSITKVIEIKFELKGIDGYCFGDDKNLYNVKTGRLIKQTINCRSIGNWINRKFYSKNRLRPLPQRPANFDVPF